MNNESMATVNEEGTFCWNKGTNPVMHEKYWTIASHLESAKPKNKRDHTSSVFQKFILKN